MDAETIKNQIISLGKVDFGNLVKMLLSKVFQLQVVNVDGPSDGGADWLVLNRDGSVASIAFQDSTQDNISDKVVADAQKVKGKLNANRYFFLSKRPKSRSTLTALQERIFDSVTPQVS